MQPCHQPEEKDLVTINMRMFKCIDRNHPVKRWEMFYIHQMKLIIIANYEWGIIKLKIGKDEIHYKLLFYQGKGGREISFFVQTVVEMGDGSQNSEDPKII
jgi:hypothetical protein